MKTKKQIDGYTCDGCGTFDTYMTPCSGDCDQHFCYECRKDNLTHYSHGVYTSGSGDGDFCSDCHHSLQGTPLLNAYVDIKRLRKEVEDWNTSFIRRKEVAEAHLQQLLDRK